MRRSVLFATAVCLAACGGADSSSTTDPGTDTTPKLGGIWSGAITTGGSENITVKWTANQTGSQATGPITLTQVGGADNPSFSLNGTMTGTISGTQAALTLTIPPGSFASLGGPQTCKLTATGTTTPTATSLTATMTLTFDASCVGTVADKATETDVLTLTKQ